MKSKITTIGIDTQTTLGKKTGFGYYVENLVEALKTMDERYKYVLLAPHTEQDFSAPRRFLWDQLQLPILAKRYRVNLLHQPAFSVPILFNGPRIVTVHDLIAVHFGMDIPLWSRQYFGHWMPYTYRFADHIISVSQYTKKDIMRLLGIPSNKISVIYHGIEEDYFTHLPTPANLAAIKKKFGITGPFLLYVGTINPRKNLVFLIEVFIEIAKQHPTLQLVIVGKKGWYYDELFTMIDKYNLRKRVILTDYINDSDKRVLYGAATVFVFPSLYEGFGLPIIEAMALQLPVIASDRSSIPEVLGDAGISLNPTDKASWVNAILKIVANRSLQKKYIAAGLKQARRFSWKNTALQTIAVYDEVLSRYNIGKDRP